MVRTKYIVCVRPDVETAREITSVCDEIIAIEPLLVRALLNEKKRHIPLLAFEMESDYVDVVLHIMDQIFMGSTTHIRQFGARVCDLGYRAGWSGCRQIYGDVDFDWPKELAALLKKIEATVSDRHLNVDFGPAPFPCVKLFDTALDKKCFTSLINMRIRRNIRPILVQEITFGRFAFETILVCERRSTDLSTGFYKIVDTFRYKYFPKYERLTIEEEEEEEIISCE